MAIGFDGEADFIVVDRSALSFDRLQVRTDAHDLFAEIQRAAKGLQVLINSHSVNSHSIKSSEKNFMLTIIPSTVT